MVQTISIITVGAAGLCPDLYSSHYTVVPSKPRESYKKRVSASTDKLSASDKTGLYPNRPEALRVSETSMAR